MGEGADDALAASASQLSGQQQQAGGGGGGVGLSVEEQVDRLIRQATSVENLCQLFFGWAPWA